MKNLKDIVLKKGDIIYFKNGKTDVYELDEEYSVGDYCFDYLITKIQRPKEDKVLYVEFEAPEQILDKEEAEWELEFGNITRSETLKLPTWEEFKEIRFVEFFYKEYDYMLQYQNISKKIALYERNNKGDYYLSDATKENYTEACRLCKKLFLGEEI